MKHIVILPYFCQEEIQRYLHILKRIASFPPQKCPYHFLLAASPRTEPSKVLEEACRTITETTSFQCPTKIFGYPEGPTAMFWDCMDFIDREFPDDGGFSLWLESDMCPIKPDWLDRLDESWQDGPTPLMMGCYVPKVYKKRLLRANKLILEDHVNGGACYAKHFAKRMPAEAKQGVFDVVVYRHAKALGKVKETDLIDFSSPRRVHRDILETDKVILHGFMQPKDEFISLCSQPAPAPDFRDAVMNPILDTWDLACRHVRVWFVRRGHRAMYENMLLAKCSSKNRAA